MTHEELQRLQPGDIVANLGHSSTLYIVTANYGNRVTAVKTVDITNPSEWSLMLGRNNKK